MKKLYSLHINTTMFYEESINGWKTEYGSYEISVIFIEHESQLDITVKKYGHIIGTVIVESDVTPEYIENAIAKIIKEEIEDNDRIDQWAGYTSERDYF
jgi:hypothetical protein